jgi:hypothetical protein
MLATERKVSVSTHRQALSALLFLYKEVLAQQLRWLQEIGRPTPRRRIPAVLAPDECRRLLAVMEGDAAAQSVGCVGVSRVGTALMWRRCAMRLDCGSSPQ